MEQKTYGKGWNLSEIASAIARELAGEQVGYEDVHAWGAPSECAALVAKGAENRILAILSEAGLDGETFKVEVSERTSAKWTYFGLDAAAGRIHSRICPFCRREQRQRGNPAELNAEIPPRPVPTDEELDEEYAAMVDGDVRDEDEGGLGFTASQIEMGDFKCDERRGT